MLFLNFHPTGFAKYIIAKKKARRIAPTGLLFSL